ncbi:hypothetical protein KGM_211443 [Danaus plexippus plexippus]|uniref:Uncharacterized protein n=1 Tax=Danaus plexippus plexippus TaxID=278856 RepID=A0A212EQ19_DANPL|nr:hypothetical protein KGM_211443 [Danaus plexippus plexippus]
MESHMSRRRMLSNTKQKVFGVVQMMVDLMQVVQAQRHDVTSVRVSPKSVDRAPERTLSTLLLSGYLLHIVDIKTMSCTEIDFEARHRNITGIYLQLIIIK